MHSFDIRIDSSDVKIDKVVVAVIPIDGFSGSFVRGELKVTIKGLLNEAIRNLSGMYVFVNLPKQPQYEIEINAEQAGYFSPAPIEFVPPVDGSPDVASKRRLNVKLMRRPTAPIDSEATIVTGVVVRSSPGKVLPVQFASVRAEFPPDILPPGADQQNQFSTLSDERGAFMLAMRLPMTDSIFDPIPIKIIFEKEKGARIDKRVIEKEVIDQEFHSFDLPIDIEGPDIPLGTSNPTLPDLIKAAK